MIQRQSSWCAGLSCLSRSSNQTNETDQRDQTNQLPATRCEMGPGTFAFPQNVPIVSAADPHSTSCAEFHEFVAS